MLVLGSGGHCKLERTEPAQNIWPMHHPWVGGSGACEGRVAPSDALGLATAVEMVNVGTAVPGTVVVVLLMVAANMV
jgi:hypothetical protein